MRQAERAAALLEPAAGLVVDQGVEHQPRIGGEILDDPVEMLQRADHRPEVADHLGIVELRERRLGDHLERLAGRVREQVEVQAAVMWTSAGINHGRRVPDKFGAPIPPPLRGRFGLVLTNRPDEAIDRLGIAGRTIA